MIEYHSIQNILDLCKEQDKKIWEVRFTGRYG